jgi:hypothetical protein
VTGERVNTEPKPFASLSSGLLARKGAARPAMRPQGFGQAGAGLEDLGWNDMGFDPPKPAHSAAPDPEHDAFGEVIPAHPHNLAGLTPVDSPVHDQQAEIAGRLSAFQPEDFSDEDEPDETAELYDPEAEAEELEAEVEAEPEVEAEFEPEAETIEAKAEILEAEEPIVSVAPVFVPRAQPAPAPRRQRMPRSAPGSKGKAAFTLRLDPDRHLKLRLACAVGGRSAQILVTDALDKLLAEMPELETLAAKAARKG